MAARFAYLRERLNTSIWLIPVGLCVISALLAVVMLWIDRRLGAEGLAPDLAMSLSSSRDMLGVIAGSIIGVGGVAFSVTMVALTLTSGQYGPKILRNFLDDNFSKLTLGLFLGTYVYALIVLASYSQVDNPRFTVLLGLMLAFSALLAFVHFIHRTATDLQADKIIHRIGGQLQRAIQDLAHGDSREGRSSQTLAWRRKARDAPRARHRLIHPRLCPDHRLRRPTALECRADCALQVRVRAGDFIVEGMTLFKAFGGSAEGLEEAVTDLNASVVVGPIRTPVQDSEYAITQLNQLAARALSPGINDPGTAITCIDWFSLALAQIVDRDIPGCVFLDQDRDARLLARMTDFPGVMGAVYAPLRRFAAPDVAVTACLLDSLCRLAQLTRRPDRLRVLARHGALIRDAIAGADLSGPDLREIRQRHGKLMALTRQALASHPAPPTHR